MMKKSLRALQMGINLFVFLPQTKDIDSIIYSNLNKQHHLSQVSVQRMSEGHH